MLQYKARDKIGEAIEIVNVSLTPHATSFV